MELLCYIPLLFAVGFIINGAVGLFSEKYRSSENIIHTVACGVAIISSAIALYVLADFIFLNHPENGIFEQIIYQWIPAGNFSVEIGFQLDALSAVMLFVVTFVGMLIHIYSTGYMHGESGYYRFFAYLNLFMFSMLLLVLGNSFLLMFVGWEGVGLCSYLLIGFYIKKKSAGDAGKKAFVVNRIGDFGFILGIFCIYSVFGTLDFTSVFSAVAEKEEVLMHMTPLGITVVTAITLALFVGATGKSAQIPLYVWLPDAMEGPTPVSALIHAATMVTAGIYMVARCHPLYDLAPISLTVVATVGALTAIFAASIGLVQNDIKKVLAYSTVSQLGYMFLGCGVGAYEAGIFHLMTHAFFKACLFLGSGSVIHAMGGEQDMRKMGALKEHMPRTYWTFLFATLAIAGIPPFAGFFSKDEILFKTFTAENPVLGNFKYFLWFLGAAAAFMTAFYMFRLVNMTFKGESRVPEETAHHLHESPLNITFPLMVLGILSLVGGFVGIPIIEGGNKFHEFLSPVFSIAEHSEGAVHEGAHSIGLEITLMVVSVAIAVAGMMLANYMYLKNKELPKKLAEKYKQMYRVLLNKYYVDEFYEAVFVNGVKKLSRFFWRFDASKIDGLVNFSSDFTVGASHISNFWDAYVVDGMVNGVAKMVKFFSREGRKIQSGLLNSYAAIMLAGVFLLVSILIVMM
ncbi:MAG: NADH-quinone oxidoreductase subunit L [Candidatus Schekmanbacteria bacterium]|nr:MAG: NADH-quinone oxidoreductase subunit L [Candidatus Schekmanbacteria bacterium]